METLTLQGEYCSPWEYKQNLVHSEQLYRERWEEVKLPEIPERSRKRRSTLDSLKSSTQSRKSSSGSIVSTKEEMASEADGDCGILKLTQPLNCGCQELISSSIVTHYGWLRKRSLRNKLQWKLFNWPRMYVVLADKNLYYFQNETSKKPTGSVSLYGFNRIMRAGERKQREAIWAFKMEHVQSNFPSLYFSATSEKEMVKWMRLIKGEMLSANGKEDKTADDSQYGGSISDQSCTSSDYNMIEASIYELPAGSNMMRPMSNVDFCDDKFDEDSSYNDFDEFATSNPLTHTAESDEASWDGEEELPPAKPPHSLPKGSSESPSKSDPHYDFGQPIPKSPQLSAEEEYWASVHFDGNKVAAAEIINRLKDPGVYLVRNSEDGSKVLVVFTNSAKKYKIEKKENKLFTLSLLNGPYFDTLEEMLYHFYTAPLPGCDQKLLTPFKLHSEFKS